MAFWILMTVVVSHLLTIGTQLNHVIRLLKCDKARNVALRTLPIRDAAGPPGSGQ